MMILKSVARSFPSSWARGRQRCFSMWMVPPRPSDLVKKHQQQQQRQEIPNDFLKWASLRFCRGSRFATGFTPLQPKTLESIIDVERAKHCSPEDLISIWDDYHLGRGHVSASMKGQLYHLLEQRAIPCTDAIHAFHWP
eukprot:TRINITY_DN9140_c0_g1_i2.p1 TRINITY_DN9140_c0_g1~~TRINITY_DN9140_c0_g1_i2.p1  ORF type:complete len:139 (-),score=23.52 TRINITY_DN9140_c0_g1_i2:421-837(-)